MAREGPGKRECSANHRRRPWRREATSSGAEDAPDEPDVVEVARQEVLEHYALHAGRLEGSNALHRLLRCSHDPSPATVGQPRRWIVDALPEGAEQVCDPRSDIVLGLGNEDAGHRRIDELVRVPPLLLACGPDPRV